jgi:hypothetical protein
MGYSKPTAALIIDIENLIGGVLADGDPSRFDIGPVCGALTKMYGSLKFRLSVGDIFFSCKKTSMVEQISSIKKSLLSNFVKIYEVSNFENVKDLSDFHIYTEALDLAYRQESIGAFAIVSMDQGFVPLYAKLKELGKLVTVVGVSRRLTPDPVVKIADSVLYYNELAKGAAAGPADADHSAPAAVFVPPGKFTLVGNAPAPGGSEDSEPDSSGEDAQPSGIITLAPASPPEEDQELPPWVTFENYLAGVNIIKSVENVLHTPVFNRAHCETLCRMLEISYADLQSRRHPVSMTEITDKITDSIWNNTGLIKQDEMQQYINKYSHVSDYTVISSMVYKAVRTIAGNDAFVRHPEDPKDNNPAIFGYKHDDPELLPRLYSGFFSIASRSDSFALDPEALAMAFCRPVTEESRVEMEEFIRKHNEYKSAGSPSGRRVTYFRT